MIRAMSWCVSRCPAVLNDEPRIPQWVLSKSGSQWTWPTVSPRIPVSSKSRLTICGWHYTCCLFCHNLRLFCSLFTNLAVLAVSHWLCWLDIFVSGLRNVDVTKFIHTLYAAKTPVMSVCESCWKCINIFNFRNLVNIFSTKYLYH